MGEKFLKNEIPSIINDSVVIIPSKKSEIISGLKIAILRSGWKIVSTVIGYFLMLLSMTFNIGIFLSIISGIAFGTLLFGGFGRIGNFEKETKSEHFLCC